MSVQILTTSNELNLFCNSLNVDGTIINGGGGSITNGTYSPTLVGISGINGSVVTNQYSYWLQLGTMVIVFMKVQYVQSGSGKPTFTASLPVARSVSGNFTNISQAQGGGGAVNTVPDAFVGAIEVDGFNGSQTVMVFVSEDTINTTATVLTSIIFSYQI